MVALQNGGAREEASVRESDRTIEREIRREIDSGGVGIHWRVYSYLFIQKRSRSIGSFLRYLQFRGAYRVP